MIVVVNTTGEGVEHAFRSAADFDRLLDRPCSKWTGSVPVNTCAYAGVSLLFVKDLHIW